MTKFIIQRIFFALIVAFVFSLALFAMSHFSGGGVVFAANAQGVGALRGQFEANLGLDAPFWAQYGAWLGGALRGDFGVSLISGERVVAAVFAPFCNTLALVAVSLGVLFLGGLGLAAAQIARPRSRILRGFELVTLAFFALPGVAVALLVLLVFGVWLGVLPSFNEFAHRDCGGADAAGNVAQLSPQVLPRNATQISPHFSPQNPAKFEFDGLDYFLPASFDGVVLAQNSAQNLSREMAQTPRISSQNVAQNSAQTPQILVQNVAQNSAQNLQFSPRISPHFSPQNPAKFEFENHNPPAPAILSAIIAPAPATIRAGFDFGGIFAAPLDIFAAIRANLADFVADISAAVGRIFFPALALILSHIALFWRTFAAALSTTLGEPFVQGALARGIGGWRLFALAALHTLGALGAFCAANLAGFLGATYAVEAVFGYAGVGRLALNAAVFKDYPVVLFVALLSFACVFCANLASEIIVRALGKRRVYV